jgi:selenocysteine lyase/cysteine desulfurase
MTGEAKTLFEIPPDITYLNCANMAPQLKAVTQAGLLSVRAKTAPWTLSAPEWFSGAEQLRTLAADVLGADAEGIALVPGASYGIALAAANLPVSRNQTIVTLDREFPSNVYAWRELAKKRGARVLTVQREPGTTWTEALAEAIDDSTAIVAVPQCHWTDGSYIDLQRTGNLARAVGAALVIDASQSAGACRLDIGRAQPDFLVAVGYKWLLGPYGLGYLYVAPKWREGTPLEHSWLTRTGSEDFTRLTEYTEEFRPGARRFDVGEFPQFVLVPMAIAALQQVLSWGTLRIERELAGLNDTIAKLAEDEGYGVLPSNARCPHMIGIRLSGGIPSGLAKALTDAKVFVSIRGDSIRVAPHLYNDSADIERLFAVLRRTV